MASGPDQTHKRSTTGDVGCIYNFCLACITLAQENMQREFIIINVMVKDFDSYVKYEM